ncbi:hypothetical protein K431DRAFT_165404 [Polychaeton citri CBS 116435]|uniref:Uncharacterized protein n=1 Tax=Polychaeton citri CBS 116435 TaxID=1314669 RepID=A0A9P4QDY3_9PEZI|nr:hypothetical protein K431DRAFT_165404 [Polychaeton citri CBS 116435]
MANETTSLTMIDRSERPTTYESFGTFLSKKDLRKLKHDFVVAVFLTVAYMVIFAFDLCIYERAWRHPDFRSKTEVIDTNGCEEYRQLSMILACIHSILLLPWLSMIKGRIYKVTWATFVTVTVILVASCRFNMLEPQRLMDMTVVVGCNGSSSSVY